jgi:uncharacterized protein
MDAALLPLCLPEAPLRQRVIILGTSGAGKSSTMRLLVEGLLADGRPVCIIDPKGDWWGLKSSASGKQAGFPVIIFGGEHAGIPLTVHARLRGRTRRQRKPAAHCRPGWLDVGDRTRFFVDFASTPFRHTRGPRWLCIDEAHNFAPQGKIMDPQAGHRTGRTGGQTKAVARASRSCRLCSVHRRCTRTT